MRRLSFLVQLSVTLAVFIPVALHVDVAASATAVSHASGGYLALAFALNVLGVSTSTALWSMLIAQGDIPYPRLWRAYITGLFYNNLGLGTVLGDGFRCATLTRAGHPPSQAIASVLAERLMAACALLILAAVGSLYFVPSHPLIPLVVWGGVGAAAIAATLACLTLPTASRRAAQRLPKLDVLQRTIAALADLRARPRLLARAFVLACAVQVCTVGSTFFVLRALDIAVTPATCFAIVPLIAVAVLMPISVQGVGVRELMYVTMFGLVGATREQALSAALLSYVTTIALTAIGAGCAGVAVLNAGSRRRTIALWQTRTDPG